jgi:membrane-associated phospholipid phosphatase
LRRPCQLGALATALTLFAVDMQAQIRDSVADRNGALRAASVAALIGVGLLEDRRIDEFARSHHTASLDRWARNIDPLGKAHYVVPGLVTSFALSELAGKRRVGNAVLRIAAGYVAADVTESILKPVVGRHRPDSTENPFRFHSFRNDERWHSFPSAHTTHAFAIAESVSLETNSPLVRDVLFASAAKVGAQRVYLGAHWTSDVIGTAMLSVMAAKLGDELARRRVK